MIAATNSRPMTDRDFMTETPLTRGLYRRPPIGGNRIPDLVMNVVEVNALQKFRPGVCAENQNSAILVMKTAEDRRDVCYFGATRSEGLRRRAVDLPAPGAALHSRPRLICSGTFVNLTV